MLVEFIIPTHNRPNPLRSMLASLVAQTNDSWSANVVIDDKQNDELVGIVKSFNTPKIYHTFTGHRYNDWGHTPREIGKQMSGASYIIMTGDDNYYTPNFVAELHKCVNDHKGPGMIYWDMVHSHFNYSFFRCSPGMAQIDMGAFATRNDLAKQIKLGVDFAADGVFVEEFKRRFKDQRMIKVEKVLFVHN